MSGPREIQPPPFGLKLHVTCDYPQRIYKEIYRCSQQIADIETAFEHVSETSDVVVAEGTGHCGVGSIVNVNNAKVASALGADMVLIANGGLGSAFDELEFNRVLCQHHNVRIAGVVVNKVNTRQARADQALHGQGPEAGVGCSLAWLCA